MNTKKRGRETERRREWSAFHHKVRSAKSFCTKLSLSRSPLLLLLPCPSVADQRIVSDSSLLIPSLLPIPSSHVSLSLSVRPSLFSPSLLSPFCWVTVVGVPWTPKLDTRKKRNLFHCREHTQVEKDATAVEEKKEGSGTGS